MAPVSLLVVAVERSALSKRARIRLIRENRDRARQTKFNEKELCRTTPVATGAVNLARYAVEARQHSRLGELCICTNLLLRCVTKRYAPTDARRIAHRTRQIRA